MNIWTTPEGHIGNITLTKPDGKPCKMAIFQTKTERGWPLLVAIPDEDNSDEMNEQDSLQIVEKMTGFTQAMQKAFYAQFEGRPGVGSPE
jgi:hypothetical protein